MYNPLDLFTARQLMPQQVNAAMAAAELKVRAQTVQSVMHEAKLPDLPSEE